MSSNTVFTNVQNSNSVEVDSSDDVSSIHRESIVRGDNDDTVKITTGYLGLDLFSSLIRGMDSDMLNDLIEPILNDDNHQELVDLFVLSFQTRDCRGGKGERDLFYQLFGTLIHDHIETCFALIKLIPEYGSFGDLTNFIEYISERYFCDHSESITSNILSFFADTLVNDWNNLKVNSEIKVSLAAKWAPRERGHFAISCSKEFKELIKLVKTGILATGNDEFKSFPLSKLYRVIITKLNTHLKTVEVSMCADRYQDIEFSKVPSVALKKWRKAFLNEKIKVLPTFEEFETGNRFPQNEGRVLARVHLKTTIREEKVKGSQLQAHEIISAFNFNNGNIHMGNSRTEVSPDEKLLLEAQWCDLRKKIQLGTPRAIIPMADVSESMIHGISDVTPISVCVALSILLSEITHPAFRDRVMTFSANPTWVNLSGISTLEEKIIKVCNDKANAQNTNLKAAFDLILKTSIKANLKAHEIPALLIFSDMQFDDACHGSTTKSVYEIAAKKFESRGLTLPQVIFWNLRTSPGFPTDGLTPGTTLLSGYSQSLFKHVVFGEEVKDQNAYDLYRKIIDDERYDPVRTILASSKELSKMINNDGDSSVTNLSIEVKPLTLIHPSTIEHIDDDEFDN